MLVTASTVGLPASGSCSAAGLTLLVAMIGAIVLTLRERLGVKRQNIAEQVARMPDEAVTLRNVPSRQGLPETTS